VEPTPELIGSLHEEALSLNRLVDDLQELALAEAGQLHLEIQPMAVLPAVEKALLAMQAKAHAQQVTLSTDISVGLPPILADPDRFQQMLRNLLDNALAHTPAGGKVGVTAAQVGSDVEFRIQDTGEGIPAEHLPLIFERFYRVDKSRTRSTGGAGLGLAIVRQLVEAQGGRVAADSTPGEGTTIRFTLPGAPVGPEPATTALPGEQAPSTAAMQTASHSTGQL